MGQTIAEKILSRCAGRSARAGDYVTAAIDFAMLHEAFALSWGELNKIGRGDIWDPERVAVILDHYVPANSERAAGIHAMIRGTARALGLPYYYGENAGVGHQVMVEKGHVVPGSLIVGADSHTCTYGALGAAGTGIGTTEMAYVLARGKLWFRVPQTIRIVLSGKLPERVSSKDVMLYIAGRYGTELAQYRAIEFCGEAAEDMSVASRMAMSNMAVELGAKFGFFAADERTLEYLAPRCKGELQSIAADDGAEYESVIEIDVAALAPQVACPHTVGNVKTVSELSGTPVQQAILGSCTNGRIEDLRAAADILRGGRIDPRTRLYVFPASQEVYVEAMDEGLLGDLSAAGAVICNASCGPCFGGHVGMLAPGEACISSTNRNFRGRMGSADAGVYLASPATVAASALRGEITDPREL